YLVFKPSPEEKNDLPIIIFEERPQIRHEGYDRLAADVLATDLNT
ncbi:13241_t:CDS:2, partial [Racocetra fulgida]